MKKKPSSCYQIILIDDHPVLVQGLTQLLNLDANFSVCGQCSNGAEAVQTLDKQKPDLIILDLSLPDIKGLDLIQHIKNVSPKSKILIYTFHDETLYGERALRAGARGYVMKNENPETVVTASHHVLKGKMWVSDFLKEHALEMMSSPNANGNIIGTLSDREFDVFQMIGHGIHTRKISERLCISMSTVNTYRTRLKEKLNLKDTADLTHYATEWIRTNA